MVDVQCAERIDGECDGCFPQRHVRDVEVDVSGTVTNQFRDFLSLFVENVAEDDSPSLGDDGSRMRSAYSTCRSIDQRDFS